MRGSQDEATPVDVSTAANPLRDIVPRAVFILLKYPPKKTRLSATVIALISPFMSKSGSQGVANPVLASKAATLFRVTAPPLTVEKYPPTYTLFPLTAMVFTCPPTSGFQGLRLPSLLIRAILLRVCPATVVNSPPINQPPLPSGTMDLTLRSNAGKLGMG